MAWRDRTRAGSTPGRPLGDRADASIQLAADRTGRGPSASPAAGARRRPPLPASSAATLPGGAARPARCWWPSSRCSWRCPTRRCLTCRTCSRFNPGAGRSHQTGRRPPRAAREQPALGHDQRPGACGPRRSRFDVHYESLLPAATGRLFFGQPQDGYHRSRVPRATRWPAAASGAWPSTRCRRRMLVGRACGDGASSTCSCGVTRSQRHLASQPGVRAPVAARATGRSSS